MSSAFPPAAPGPLSHLKVLDLSRVLAGPWAGQLLGDMGADVVKVERPGAGDDTRGWGPPWLGNEARTDGMSAYFLSCNRNKRSIAIDIATPEGAALVLQLAAQADVVIENYKAGGLDRYGLGPEQLLAHNPRLVVCSITGFGHTGPLRERAGYDLMIQAMGGLMSLTGEADGAPTKTGVAVADLMTGMYAVSGILAAIVHRDRTGQGQHLDLALFDTQIAWLANQGLNALTTGKAPVRMGNAHPNLAPYQVFLASDGHFVLAVGNDSQFAAFARLADHPEWAADARFAHNADRVAHRAELVDLVAAAISTRTRADWEAGCEAAGIPCGAILDVNEALAHPQITARGGIVEQQTPEGEVVRTLPNPLHFSATPVSFRAPPPSLDADHEAVLADWLGR